MALLRLTSHRARARSGTRDRGVALVAVLLLVAGLIAIATAVVTLSASQRRAAQRAYEADMRREMLDGALRVALAEISFGKVQGPFWHPRQPRIVKVAGERVEVTLERESGRIDLNTADEKYLVAALVVSGMAESEARTGAARIRDWIDADDKSAEHGAEIDDYRKAGLDHGPRNGQMESVDEVRQVLGMRDLSDANLDAFTVYSQQIEPAAAEAPQVVRDALQWIATSAGEGGSNAPPPLPALPDADQPVSYAGSVVRLRACIEGRAAEPCRVTVQRVTGSARAPFQVLLWR
jgi:type II secretory pathway component PulK